MYRPLEDSSRELFAEFAETEYTASAILAFASRYGLLGLGEGFVRSGLAAMRRKQQGVEFSEYLIRWQDLNLRCFDAWSRRGKRSQMQRLRLFRN